MNEFFSQFVNILGFVIFLGILVFLHELGHYLTARLFKIEVEEFGLGFPPRMVRLFRRWGTDFTLNWIPFGAFVRPKGENDPAILDGLGAANPWKRLVVMLGGPVMNLITGIFLFSLVFTQMGAPDQKTVQIMEVSPESPAAMTGLMSNDILVEINGETIDSTQKLTELVQANKGKEINLVIKRSGEQLRFKVTPRVSPPPGQGSLGIVMGNPVVPLSWFQALPLSVYATYEQGRQLVMLPAMLIRQQIPAEQARVVGPIGMYDIYQQARERDIETSTQPKAQIPAVNTLLLMAVISVALGVTNLLPIPALDGGRILFLLPEIIFRRRIPADYENIVHLVGFVSLIAFMVYVTTQDIINPIVLPK